MENNNNSSKLIYEKIIAIMGDIGVIKKESNNDTQHYKYRGVDAVMNALQPALIKHQVFVVPEILSQERQERVTAKSTLLFTCVKVKYRFFAADGSFIETVVVGEGMDSGDKSSNKAMSAAFKYAMFQVFCIPTDELKDPDAESYELPGYQQQVPPQYGYQPEPQAYAQPQGYAQPQAYQQPMAQQMPPQMPQAQNITVNDAYNVVCSFGKNQGKTLGQIASQPRSSEDLNWLANARPGSPEAIAASMILQSRVM